MKWLLRAAARLYPRAWRDRYGEEFDVFIDDLCPRWRDVTNVLIGALLMHMSRPSLLTLAAGLTVVGAIAGAAVSLTRPPVFVSSSRVLVTVLDAGAVSDAGAQHVLHVMDAALDNAALDKRNIAVTVHGDAGRDPMMLELIASGDSPQGAKGAADRAVNAVITANLRAQENRPPDLGVQFKVLGAPPLPTTALRPVMRFSLFGAAAGLIAAAAIQILSHFRRRPTAS